MRNYNADIAYAQRDCPEFLKGSYQADPQEIAYIVSNPMQWLSDKQKARKRFEGKHYLVTFTRNPNSKHNLEAWLTRVNAELHKSYVEDVIATIEKMTENIHCHAIITSSRILSKRDYKVFSERYGHIDIRRINVDNGVQAYIEKEYPEDWTPVCRIDFLNYYRDQLKELKLIIEEEDSE